MRGFMHRQKGLNIACATFKTIYKQCNPIYTWSGKIRSREETTAKNRIIDEKDDDVYLKFSS